MSIESKIICNTCGWSGSEDEVNTISGMSACPRCCEAEDLDFNDDFEVEPTEEELVISETERDDFYLDALREDYIESRDCYDDDDVLCNTCGWVGTNDELDREGMIPACPNCYEDEDLESLDE